MKKRTFDDFDSFAKDYRDLHTENVKITGADSNYFANFKVTELQGFESNTPLKVLDLGCGDGVVVGYMEQHFPNWEVTGIDVSAESIEAAKQKEIKARFSVYNGSNIMEEDETFDIIFIAGVLHHIDYALHGNFLLEVRRVLKTEGRLYIFEHNPYNPFTRYLVNTCVFDEHARLLSAAYLKKEIKRKGFTRCVINYVLFFPRNKLFQYLLPLEKFLKRFPIGGQYYLRTVK